MLERILLPIVNFKYDNERQKPSQVESTENERKYSISGAIPPKVGCLMIEYPAGGNCENSLF